MVETVPVPSWTPPVMTPVSRPSSGQVSRQDAFDNALKRADSSRSSEPTEDEETSVDESEVGEGEVTGSLTDRSSLGESAGRLRFDDHLLKKGDSDGKLNPEAANQMANGGPGEIRSDSSTHATSMMPSAAQTQLLVETVSAMMMRLERMPGANAGQWQFNLLNDPAGISSLQLQRAINGSWKVSVSMLSSSAVDQEQHAGELKSALEQRGHTVDWVEISAAKSGDVVSAELDEA